MLRTPILYLPTLILLGAFSALANDNKPAADGQQLTDLSLEDLLQVTVQSASMHDQTLRDAPASVTVITQEQIRKFGYRTLSDALRYVRGFYDSYDRTLHSPGVRGFNLPGDYGSRLLVLIDGHNLATGSTSSNVFGQEFPVDLSLIKQIEIVRGPNSALYGSNAMLATINIITLSPQEVNSPEARLEAGNLGEKKIQLSTPLKIGNKASLLLSGSLFNNAGQNDIYLPAFDAPETNNGHAIGVDGEHGYHLFANFRWKNWSVLAMAADRIKVQPVSWTPTAFGDTGTRYGVGGGLVDVGYTREWNGKTLQWHTYYDAFRLHGYLRVPSDDTVLDVQEHDADDRVGSKLTLRAPVGRLGTLTVGTEARLDLRSSMRQGEVKPDELYWLDINKPDRSLAVFAQDEIDLSSKFQLNVGVRAEEARFQKDAVAPRAALLYHFSDSTTYKFLYGRSFRNPTAYEMFFDDGLTQVANLAARPERADTFEVVAERRIRKGLNASVSMYHYQMLDMLMAEYLPSGLLQYQNGGRDQANGVELEVDSALGHGIDISGSISLQRTIDGLTRFPLPGSAGQIGKLRASVPLFRNRFGLAGGMQFLGRRQTLAGNTLNPVFLPDLVLTTNRLNSIFDLQFGVYNLANQKYSDPVALTPAVDCIPSPGRTVFVSMIWHLPEGRTAQPRHD